MKFLKHLFIGFLFAILATLVEDAIGAENPQRGGFYWMFASLLSALCEIAKRVEDS